MADYTDEDGAAMQLTLDCEMLQNRVYTVNWAWEALESQTGLMEDVEELRTFAGMMFSMLERDVEELRNKAITLRQLRFPRRHSTTAA
jgi:hypothetical protein